MNVRCRENPRAGSFSRLGSMPRPLVSLPVLALAAAMALGLAACGEEDAELLSGETAREIVANLDTVDSLAEEGDCVGAESATRQVREQIEAIEGVDPELKQNLERGAARLEEVIVECEEASAEAAPPATFPEEDEEEGEEEAKKEKPKKDGKDEDEEEEPSEAETGPDTPTSPSLPPPAEGEAKGHEKGGGESGGGEEPSGGVSPGAPAGDEGGDD